MSRKILISFVILFFISGCATTASNKTHINETDEPNYVGEASKGYYKTGELKYSYLFKDGIRQGVTKEYYKNGTLKSDWIYENDKLQSGSKGYYKTGELKYLYQFVDGTRDGITKEFYKDGKLKSEWIYKNGELQ